MVFCLLYVNRLMPGRFTRQIGCSRFYAFNLKSFNITHAQSFHSQSPLYKWPQASQCSPSKSSANCNSALVLSRKASTSQSNFPISAKDLQASKQDEYHQIRRKLSEKYDIAEDNGPTSRSMKVSPLAAETNTPTAEPDDYYTSFDPETDGNLEDGQRLSAEELVNKYDYISKSRAKGSDVVINAPYGSVRIDSLNKGVKDGAKPSSSLPPNKFANLAKLGVPWHSEESEASQRQQRRKRTRNMEASKMQTQSIFEEQFFPNDDYYVVDISAKNQEEFSSRPGVQSYDTVPQETMNNIREEEREQNFFDEQFFPMSESGSEVSVAKQPVQPTQNINDIDHSLTQRNSYEKHYISESNSDFPKLDSQQEATEKSVIEDQGDNYFDEQLLSHYTPSKSSSLDVEISHNNINNRAAESVEATESFSLNHECNQDHQLLSSANSEEKLFISAHTLSSSEASNEFDAQYFHSQTNEQDSLFNVAEKVDIATNNKPVIKSHKTKERQVDNILEEVKDEKETAFDVAMKIRKKAKETLQKNEVAPAIIQKWEGKIDSHGYKILEDQVDRLKYSSTDDVVSLLRNNILYEDENLLAINKPYGLPSHGGPGVHHSVGGLLDPLAKKINPRGAFTLYLSHRLDKETTGVMLLPKNQEYYVRVRGMFKKREVIKKYWAITKGIPDPCEGIIDIPMGEGRVEGMVRMTLLPKYQEVKKVLTKSGSLSSVNKSKKEKFDAVTYFKVLDSNNSVALVECQPETGVKHQIRCHLAFGLNCPILGDHKYSHFSKIAPQKLFPEVLTRLGIRQSKVRHLAMHLHAKSLILPNFKDGRNLFISAKLPKHFVQNMKWLKLSGPKK